MKKVYVSLASRTGNIMRTDLSIISSQETGERDNQQFPVPLQSRAELGLSPDCNTPIYKFYKKYGVDWLERFRKNEGRNFE